ncbi:MAG: bifunctional 2-C-methyl-D-erythritol 4-phosphate cytidylyltransferase/2-C-methyl-D-erythritol 2,4-cyclodiphosphate synthase [Rhizobiales bacterium]|nr:bifunctional 2-C-methyl-D-erythritol 4-phosphate cytidylyltransferase/2-C-methyl-D-erythritol 2,4-cyclodiphosphate synthase [Hyphomicrobiales bacterium]
MADAANQQGSERSGVVIVAAGRGSRVGAGDVPKQYRMIGGVPILRRSVEAFSQHPKIADIIVVIGPDDGALFQAAMAGLEGRVRTAIGGASRQASVRAGLEALRDSAPAKVLIHDAARPFVDGPLIDRTLAAIDASHGALPAIPVSDTLKRGDAAGMIVETVARAGLFAAQTPQGFPYGAILRAHRNAAEAGRDDFTDDAALAEWAGMPARLVEGSPANVKLTWQKDIEMADLHLSAARVPDVRVGNGYDVHAFEPGDHVWLCGVRIPHTRRLSGHSDADVALHALTDALLATCGAGDIGVHFPPSDPQWKGAASHIFLSRAAELVRGRGGRIGNVDVTLICEAPRIGPHRDAMVKRMAEILNLDPERVSVKATTNERLGFIGREEGIAAIATATVIYGNGAA